jgi:hypothetical protein
MRVYRDGPATVIDLPNVDSRDVEWATGGRDSRWEPLAGVSADHPPLLRYASIGDIEEWLTGGVKGQIGEARPCRGEESAGLLVIGNRGGQRWVLPLHRLGDHGQGGGQVSLIPRGEITRRVGGEVGGRGKRPSITGRF